MKKVLSFLLSAALVTVTVLAAPWPAWSGSGRSWAAEHSISHAFTDSPETVMTRGMTAQLLYEAAGKPPVDTDSPFSDVSGSYAAAIGWAAQQGYVMGLGNGRYAPEQPVSRQEFAVILHRKAGSPQAAPGVLAPYSDRGQLASWAFDAAGWCVSAGVMNGQAADRLAPGAGIKTAEALLMMKRAEELPDLTQMRQDLEVLAEDPRAIGSSGEQAAVEYLQGRFAEMGLSVSIQSCTDEAGAAGSNVIAVRPASVPNADILILSAHHDSVPTAPGANDNASGTAALLYAAEALKDIQADTELRFISFTDEENGKNGSRFYTSSVTKEEKARMIGNIQFDMLGGLGSNGAMVCTADGQGNWVSDLLQEKESGLMLGAETASDHMAFQLAGVPAVLLMQSGRGYLYHSAADTADQLNLYAIARTAQTAVSAVKEVADPQTPSYQEAAAEQSGNYTYCQTRENVIYFDSSLEDTEAYIGLSGELTDHREVAGNGWSDSYDTYRYAMRWFGGTEPMSTYYQYRNGFLQNIEIRPFENGYTTAQIRTLIKTMYGEPSRSGTDREGRPSESWQDEVYGKYITLTDAPGGCTVTVSKYNVGVSNVLSTYPVRDGQAEITDPEDKQVWDLLCSILPAENRKKITQFQLFTDGASNILAYTSPIMENGTADNTRFSVSVDYYDVYDENGAPRDWSKLIYTLLHEYGHVLLEDETQVDLTVGKTTHDPAGFIPGSFRKAFYDRFWAELGDSAADDYAQNPTHYVSRYGANYFHEDIADTFAVFLLGGKPDGTSVAEQKLLFFWKDPDMVALRTAVRRNLGLEPPAEPELSVANMEELSNALVRAIAEGVQPPVFDVSSLPVQSTAEMDVRNAYFQILSRYPEYKYAYDLTAKLEKNLLTCEIAYMPYHTGNYPAGFQGTEVDGLAGLIQTAREHLDKESIPIRITNRSLTVDDMNKALQQAGGMRRLFRPCFSGRVFPA